MSNMSTTFHPEVTTLPWLYLGGFVLLKEYDEVGKQAIFGFGGGCYKESIQLASTC
jgi:hypothetical protein